MSRNGIVDSDSIGIKDSDSVGIRDSDSSGIHLRVRKTYDVSPISTTSAHEEGPSMRYK